MKFLCKHHQERVKSSPTEARTTWHNLMAQGLTAHQEQNFKTAYQCFTTASEVACMIVEKTLDSTFSHYQASVQTSLQKLNLGARHSDQQSAPKCDPVEMWLLASHNLFATLCRQGELIQAEETIYRLHEQMIQLCLKANCERNIRISALANLDTSLFTLTAHLGQLGKIDKIYNIIRQTEEAAEKASRQLFH